MAVATPVLERNEVTEEEKVNYGVRARMMAEEEHNARIKRNYAMLINPETKIDEMLGRNDTTAVVTEAPKAQVTPVAASVEIIERKPYFVENARADAAIFRADNPINRRALNMQPQADAVQDSEEEENEDLRPTLTTIQYRTTGVQNTVEEGKIENVGAEKRTGLKKKEKIIIAVVVSIIVALFALIIINSAIISNINNDISSLQSSLTTVKGTYAGVSDQINSFTANLIESVQEFARINGMVKLG